MGVDTLLDYKQMKEVLKASPERLVLTHFTKAFYETYCEAWRTGEWEPVYATDFYIKDGFSYCVFLELFNASLPRWRLTFIKMQAGYPSDIAQRYIHEDTEESAKARGLSMLEQFGAEYVDVIRVY